MSTRTNIVIKWGRERIVLYHHHDGYPEGVGADLKLMVQKNYLNSKYQSMLPFYVANRLVKNNYGMNDGEYEVTSNLHGDVEYIYEIDCKKKTVTCYGCDEGDAWGKPVKNYRKDWMICPIPDTDHYMYQKHDAVNNCE